MNKILFLDLGLPDPVAERMTFDQLVSFSDPKRVTRSSTVKVPPLKFDAFKDAESYYFNAKSYPSTTGLRHHGVIQVFKPRNPNTPLEKCECTVDCQCLGPDTLVLMSDGNYKPISEIRPGDSVYTHLGRVRRVIGNVARPLRDGEKTYQIRAEGFPLPMVATSNHPFMALRGNTECRCGCKTPLGEMHGAITTNRVLSRKFAHGHAPSTTRISDEVILGVLAHPELNQAEIVKKFGVSKGTVTNIRNGVLKPSTKTILADEPTFQRVVAGDLRQREWFFHPWLNTPNVPKSIDSDFARFLGYYLAEGNVDQIGHAGNRFANRINFTFHISEENTLGRDVTEIVTKMYAKNALFRRAFEDPYFKNHALGELVKKTYNFGETQARQQQSFDLKVYLRPETTEFILKHFGAFSEAKFISEEFQQMDDATIINLLTGLFLGDGHVKKKGYFRWTSASTKLVWNVSTLLWRLKVKHNITNIGPDGYAIDIGINPHVETVLSWLRPYVRDHVVERIGGASNVKTDTHTFESGVAKVMTVRKEIEHNDVVYDLCVEEDHTFIANGCVVFNCPDYKYRWAWSNKQRGSSRVGSQSLNQAWNQAPRKTNPSNRPGLCKHILAIRNFIYGQYGKFSAERESSTVSKLDRLVAASNRRWQDFPGEMAAAKARDVQIKQSVARAKANKAALAQGKPLPYPDAPPAQAPAPKPVSPTVTPAQLDRQQMPSFYRGRLGDSTPVVNSMNLLEEIDGLISAEKKKKAIPDEKSEVLDLLREIRDIVRNLAGEDLPPDLEGGSEEVEKIEIEEPGIPVEATLARKDN